MLDEVPLSKHELHRDTGRKCGFDFLQSFFDLSREFERVETRCFVDAEHHAFASIHAGVTAHGLDGVGDLCDIAHEHGALCPRGDDRVRDVLEIGGHAEISHHDLSRTGLKVTAGGISRGSRDGGFQFF